ncbi:MAG: hypothetical protein WCR96_00445 [Candidatus Methanomethylophilaceae archaeon]
MKYFTCKCGEKKFWGSGESPKPCQVCQICGTTMLKLSDESYVEPKPHTWTTEETYRDGKLVESHCYCKMCYDTKPKENK